MKKHLLLPAIAFSIIMQTSVAGTEKADKDIARVDRRNKEADKFFSAKEDPHDVIVSIESRGRTLYLSYRHDFKLPLRFDAPTGYRWMRFEPQEIDPRYLTVLEEKETNRCPILYPQPGTYDDDNSDEDASPRKWQKTTSHSAASRTLFHRRRQERRRFPTKMAKTASSSASSSYPPLGPSSSYYVCDDDEEVDY